MAVVYLPALPLTYEMYEATMREVPGVGFNYPGFAGRPLTNPQMQLQDYAQDILQQMDAQGISQADIVGTSWGGAIALYLAANHPERVGRLVISSTHGLPPVEEERQMFEGIAQAIEQHGPMAVYDNFAQLLFTEKTIHSSPDIIERFRNMFMQASKEGLVTAFRALGQRPDPTPWFSRIQAPTLLIYGAEDKAIPPGHAEAIQQGIQGSRLVRLPECGHYPSLEQAEAYTREVKLFLS